jgi:hypothetical protein
VPLSELSSRQQIDYVKDYCRRLYQNDLAGLKTLAQQIFESATDEVVLTTTSFEGGTSGGQVKFNKMLAGIAVEELISEIDPNYVAPLRSRIVVPDYRFCTP